MKKMSLFLSMLAAVSLTAAPLITEAPKTSTQENLERVYVDVNKIFQQSSAGRAIGTWSEAKNRELNTLLTAKQADLRKMEQEILSGLLPEESVTAKTAALELEKRKAELEVQSTKLAMETELGQKMKTVEKDISSTIQQVAAQKNWLEVVNKNEAKALFFSPKLDATETILAEFNNKTRADAAKEVLRSDSTTAPKFLSA
jgi:Skp family chaperone for outer membrane proteins